MSPNNKNEKLNNVSSSNLNNDAIEKQAKVIIENSEYEEFCKKYANEDFSDYKIHNLKIIQQNGKGMLEQHYIMKDNVKNDTIMQLQYIVDNIRFEIWNKHADNIKLENYSLNKKLEKAIQRAQQLEKDSKTKHREIKHMKDDMKGIISTIVAIILTISIIPTAITGIENIDSNYILPFLSSIILFGMIMIVFVYSIYQDKIKISTWIVLIFALILSIIFWIAGFRVDIRNNLQINRRQITIETKI